MGLSAIWLIWCSPCTLVTVRVVVPAHASPEITWPEDLGEGEEEDGWMDGARSGTGGRDRGPGEEPNGAAGFGVPKIPHWERPYGTSRTFTS